MIFLDIETNTAHNTIWICVTMKDGVIKRHTNPDSLKQVLDGDIVCGHNIIGFDAPVLRKVWGVDINDSLLCDTLIMSRLYKPDIDIAVIEGQNLAISPEDIIVIPEIYGHVMEQLKNFPCGKIVLCQAYDHKLFVMLLLTIFYLLCSSAHHDLYITYILV